MRNTINKPIPLTGTSLALKDTPSDKRGRNSAFTLVELIIVITILAILATIGFMSFQSYTIDARDANRITSLKTMSDGLQIYEAKKSTLPDPDPQTVGIYSGGLLISTQGYAGTSVLQKLKASDIKDPSDNTYYTYIVNSDKTKYQLLSMLEKDSSLAINNNILNEAYAQTDYTSRYAYTIGNKVGVFFSGTTNNTPIQETMSGDLELTTGGNATKLFKVMFSNSTSASGTITATGLELPEIIQTETNSIAISTQNAAIYSCTGTLIEANAIISNNTNLISDTTYQTTNSSNSCYYTCKATYSGTNCENREVYGDEDIEAITACNKWVETAVGTSAGGYANWLWVPASKFTTDGYGTRLTDTFYNRIITYNGINYTCKGFAVMKYEAKFASTTSKIQPNASRNTWAMSDYATDNDTYSENLSNNIVSKRTDYPIANLRQGEAIQACAGLTYGGKTSHLLTNNEWRAITRNIEQQATNWTNGAIGNGGIYRGNVNLTDNMSYSSFGLNSIYTQAAGNYTDARGTNAMGNRRLILSNSSNIWDISGNVWEHVNKSNLPTTSNLRATNTWNSSTDRLSNSCGGSAWYSFNGNDGVAACAYTNSYTYANIGPLTTGLNSANGIGRIYSYSTASNVFLRGGNGGSEAKAGVFALHLTWSALDQNYTGGFRCSL